MLFLCSLVVFSLLGARTLADDAPRTAYKKSQIANIIFKQRNYDKQESPLFFNSSGTLNVTLSVSINHVEAIDSLAGTYVMSATYRFRYQDVRLSLSDEYFPHSVVNNAAMPITFPISDVWYPDLLMMNAIACEKTDELWKLYPYGECLYDRVAKCTLISEHDLRLFPFDSQVLHFSMSSFNMPASELSIFGHFDPEPSKGGSAVWDLTGSSFQVASEIRQGQTFNVARGELYVSRMTGSYFLKFILPLNMIVLVSQLLYFVDRKHASGRIGGGLTAMLSLAAINLLLSNIIPSVNYPTLLDGFVLACFIFCFISCSQSIFVGMVSDDSPRAELVEAIERWFRLAMIPIWIAVAIAVLTPASAIQDVCIVVAVLWGVACAIYTGATRHRQIRLARKKRHAQLSDPFHTE
jgi:hypothetical protein